MLNRAWLNAEVYFSYQLLPYKISFKFQVIVQSKTNTKRKVQNFTLSTATQLKPTSHDHLLCYYIEVLECNDAI